MVKLIIGATVALLIAAVGGVLGVLVDAPNWLTVVGAIAAAVAVPLGAGDALAQLVTRIPAAVQREIALWFGVAIAALEATSATALNAPTWLHIVLGVLIALAGVLGIRVAATPVIAPRDADGRPLVPATSRQTLP